MALFDSGRPLSVGDSLPDVEAFGKAGVSVRLRDLVRERPLLVVFLRSTFCTGCMAYARHMAEWRDPLHEAGLPVALVLTEGWKRTHRWAEEDRMPMLVLADESRDVAKKFGVYKALGFDSFRHARPSAFAIDTKHAVRWSQVFPENEEDAPKLKEYLELAALLGQPGVDRVGEAGRST